MTGKDPKQTLNDKSRLLIRLVSHLPAVGMNGQVTDKCTVPTPSHVAAANDKSVSDIPVTGTVL
jgi:hypothetical protein